MTLSISQYQHSLCHSENVLSVSRELEDVSVFSTLFFLHWHSHWQPPDFLLHILLCSGQSVSTALILDSAPGSSDWVTAPWLCIGSGQLAMSDSPPAPVTKYWYNNTHQVSPPTNHWAHQTTFKWITNWMKDSVKLYFRKCFPDKLLNPRHSVVSTLIVRELSCFVGSVRQ